MAAVSDSKRRKIAEGVPLAMLYKREISVSPELVMLSDPRSVATERFRRLKTRIVHEFAARVILITSGIPGEGKSTVAFNLALALAGEAGEKTILVDADLRKGSIGRQLKPPPKLGLTEVISGEADLVHAILHVKDTVLDVLPAGGTPPDDPLEILASRQTKAMITGLRETYDRVVIDSPPIIPFSDADELGALTDGIILVARANLTPKSVFKEAIKSITSGKILGVVLNGVSTSVVGGRSAYERYYDAYYDKDRTRS